MRRLVTGRIGETITDPILIRCEGCGQSQLMCQVCWDHDDEPCCTVCTHLHELSQ